MFRVLDVIKNTKQNFRYSLLAVIRLSMERVEDSFPWLRAWAVGNTVSKKRSSGGEPLATDYKVYDKPSNSYERK